MTSQTSQSMRGKVALVTGASSGIGRDVALTFAERGASVVLVSLRQTERGQQTVAEIEALGGKAIYVQADVASEDSARMLVEKTVSAYGRLDYACNNAGYDGPFSTIDSYDSDEFRRIIGVNMDGVFFGMKHQAAQMLKQGGGAIVNISSLFGGRGYRLMAPYSAAKHAVNGMTKTAAIDYATLGIRVNAVAPGAILTPMLETIIQQHPGQADAAVQAIPMKRMGQASEVAKAVVWLCSEDASYITGQVIGVDGGLSAG